MTTATIIVKNKHQTAIPPRLLRHLGVNVGDKLEARIERRQIVFTPKTAIDYSKFPDADDEYTPAQRRYIDTRLAKARKGPYYGPFETHEEMIEFLHSKVKTTRKKK